MASKRPLPTIKELLDAFSVGASSKHPDADTHRGSGYDVAAGMGAMLWSRSAVRDREVFRAVYLDGCQDSALDYRVAKFGGPARLPSTRGTGTVTISYDLVWWGSSPGTFWAGTRIAVTSGNSVKYYRLTENYTTPGDLFTWAGSQYIYLTLPIEADEIGPGSAVDSTSMPVGMAWEDPNYDSNWLVSAIQCSDGTSSESDVEYLSRFRAWSKSRRTGYTAEITRKLLECGAVKVAIFESDFVTGEDFAINRVFVGDNGYSTPQSLLDTCRVALDSCVPFGCTTTVGAMTLAQPVANLTLQLSKDKSEFNLSQTTLAAHYAVKRAIGSSQTAYVFRRDSLLAELSRALPDLQNVVFEAGTTTDTDVASIMSSGANGNLTIYNFNDLAIRVAIEGA